MLACSPEQLFESHEPNRAPVRVNDLGNELFEGGVDDDGDREADNTITSCSQVQYLRVSSSVVKPVTTVPDVRRSYCTCLGV